MNEKDLELDRTHEAMPYNADVDLGDGHWLRWTQYEGQRTGGIIMHTARPGVADGDDGLCRGAFWIRGSTFVLKSEGNRPQWDLTETEEGPTLSPSFLCHCGDHGFVQKGKWVRA